MDEGADRTIAVINSKGGVGKTTAVANIAGQLASTYRVLVVDLDPQGHLGIPLGYYEQSGVDDAGMRIVDSLQDDEPLADPVRNVRPNLDVYPGGSRLVRIQALELSGEILEGAVSTFARRLAEVSADYDFTLIDCPPGERLLQQMALGAARYVVVPIDTGVGATKSVTKHLAPLVTRARKENPELTYLGAVVCKQPPGSTRVLRNTRLRLDEFAEHVPVFDTYIRNAVKSAQDSEQRGQLVHELAGDRAAADRAYFEALRSGDADKLADLDRISGTAKGLADDFRALALEMARRVASHEETTPIRKSR